MNDQLFNVKFVGEVEKYQCLYNYKLSEYSRKDVTEKARNEVGKKVKLTGMECKEKWKNLRAIFVRHMKPTSSGSGAKQKKPYYLSEAMLFTLPFIKALIPITPGNLLEIRCEGQDNTPDIYQGEDEGSQLLETPSPQQPGHSSQLEEQLQSESSTKQSCHRKRKRPVSDVDDNLVEYIKANNKTDITRSSTDLQSNPKKMFLLSLLPELDEMDARQMKMFKHRVLDLIDIMSTPSDTTNQRSVSSPFSTVSLKIMDSQSIAHLDSAQSKQEMQSNPPTARN